MGELKELIQASIQRPKDAPTTLLKISYIEGVNQGDVTRSYKASFEESLRVFMHGFKGFKWVVFAVENQ